MIDPGADAVTQFNVDWGDGEVVAFATAGNLPGTVTHIYADGPATRTINVQLVDEDGTHPVGSRTIEVANEAPIASVTGPATAVLGQSVSFVFSAADVAVDVFVGFTFEVDWEGDGIVDDLLTGTVAAANHVFTASGAQAVSVVAVDKDGGRSTLATHTVTVTANAALLPDPLFPGLLMLVVSGTTGDDIIRLSTGASPGEVTVQMNGASEGTFQPTSRVVVHAGVGNDLVLVDPTVSLPAWLFGGDNNDALFGGGGPNVLVGGDGNDLLTGRGQRDLLIGGRGVDLLLGGGDSDLLIAGFTAFDADEAALAAIQAEWLSLRTYAQRLANLQGLANPTFAARLNGNVFMQASGPSATVFDDGDADLLFGGGGTDAYFADLDAGALDLLLAFDAGELRIDID